MHIKKVHVDSKPFYDFIKTETTFHGTDEQGLFGEIKHRISEDTVLAITTQGTLSISM